MRKRDISPSFWRDERVWKLSCDGARLTFIGVWMVADREGRLLDKPFDIAVEVRAWDVAPVAGFIEEFVTLGLLVRYEVGGTRCLAIPAETWSRHQKPHPKEAPSKLPGIPQTGCSPGITLGSSKADGTEKGAPLPGQAFQASQASQASHALQAFQASQTVVPSEGDPRGKKRKRKSQVELPTEVVPPKPAPKQSLQQKLYALFIDDRDARCVELGLQPTPADEQHGPAYLNSVIGRWLKEWEHVEASASARAQGFTGAESRVRCLFQEYLDLDWPAECKQRVDGKDSDVPQPYPFRVLGSEKVWRKLAAQLWPDDARQAEGVH